MSTAFGAPMYSPLPIETTTSKLSPTSKFIKANNIVSNDVICVKVDMFRTDHTDKAYSVYWWEAELKVLDNNGNVLYHVSTRWNDKKYHPEAWDSQCQIYYYLSGKNSSTGVCARPKKKLNRSSANSGNSIQYAENGAISTSFISENFHTTLNESVTAIEFYPNLDGTTPAGNSIREIFLNPENTVIVSRKNKVFHEQDISKTRIWRVPIITYYRK